MFTISKELRWVSSFTACAVMINGLFQLKKGRLYILTWSCTTNFNKMAFAWKCSSSIAKQITNDLVIYFLVCKKSCVPQKIIPFLAFKYWLIVCMLPCHDLFTYLQLKYMVFLKERNDSWREADLTLGRQWGDNQFEHHDPYPTNLFCNAFNFLHWLETIWPEVKNRTVCTSTLRV